MCGGLMKKSAIVALSVVVLILVGTAIIAWSVHQKRTSSPDSINVKSFTDENFEADVVQASKTLPILVDFYAEWCFPCRMLDPILEDVAKDLKGLAVIGKVDTDKNLIARRFGIRRIPTVLVIKDGEIKSAFYGVVPKEQIVKAIKESGS
jgi:thioredoxin 1